MSAGYIQDKKEVDIQRYVVVNWVVKVGDEPDKIYPSYRQAVEAYSVKKRYVKDKPVSLKKKTQTIEIHEETETRWERPAAI